MMIYIDYDLWEIVEDGATEVNDFKLASIIDKATISLIAV